MMTIEQRRACVRRALKNRRTALKAQGKCRDCGHGKPAESKTLCQVCLDERKAREVLRRARNKTAITEPAMAA